MGRGDHRRRRARLPRRPRPLAAVQRVSGGGERGARRGHAQAAHPAVLRRGRSPFEGSGLCPEHRASLRRLRAAARRPPAAAGRRRPRARSGEGRSAVRAAAIPRPALPRPVRRSERAAVRRGGLRAAQSRPARRHRPLRTVLAGSAESGPGPLLSALRPGEAQRGPDHRRSARAARGAVAGVVRLPCPGAHGDSPRPPARRDDRPPLQGPPSRRHAAAAAARAAAIPGGEGSGLPRCRLLAQRCHPLGDRPLRDPGSGSEGDGSLRPCDARVSPGPFRVRRRRADRGPATLQRPGAGLAARRRGAQPRLRQPDADLLGHPAARRTERVDRLRSPASHGGRGGVAPALRRPGRVADRLLLRADHPGRLHVHAFLRSSRRRPDQGQDRPLRRLAGGHRGLRLSAYPHAPSRTCSCTPWPSTT